MSIEQDIAALQADVADRTKDRARAEHELAQAEAGRYEAALKAAVEKTRQHLAQAEGDT
jgi:hypothetical protein